VVDEKQGDDQAPPAVRPVANRREAAKGLAITEFAQKILAFREFGLSLDT
jgi:hypothetical protein